MKINNMRTLQEKYNAIQEGNFSKDQFLVEARMQQPHLITRFNGYDDAVQILKNRGMIVETAHSDIEDRLRDAPVGARATGGGYGPFEKIKTNTWKNLKAGSLQHSEALAKHIGGFDDFKVTETVKESYKSGNLYQFEDGEVWQVVAPVTKGEKVFLKPYNKKAKEGNVSIAIEFTPEELQAAKKLNEASYKTSANSKEAQHLKKGDIITSGDEVVGVSTGARTPSGKVEVTLKNKNGKNRVSVWGKTTKIGIKPVNEARLTKNNLTDYRYKPTNDMDKYPYEQILRGLRVELETMSVQGTPTAEEYKKALAKVLKNLEKDEIFYTNQLAGNSKKVDLHDKMVDATAKNTVDTFNGMKKIKDLKEDHTKNKKDKYVVKFSKANNTYQVWEGDKLVTDFAIKEKAKAYADRENAKQGLTESVLKEGIKNLIRRALTENEEDVYEMQGPKSDDEYKSELADYLEDNQIYGYTNKIHDLMTGPDEDQSIQDLADFLQDNQIYGYSRGIERIYADYPYDQHWMNQPDEDEVDDIPHPRGYEEASDEESFEDLMEEYRPGQKVTFTNKNDGNKYEGTVVQDLGNGRFTFRAEDGKVYGSEGLGRNWKIQVEAVREGINEESDEDKLARYKSYTYMLDGEVVSPKIGYYNNYIGAELDGEFLKVSIPNEDGVVQLRYPQGKTGIYTENIFESVSLKDLL